MKNRASKRSHKSIESESIGFKKNIRQIVRESAVCALTCLLFVAAHFFATETNAGEEFPKCNSEVGSVKYIEAQTHAEKAVTELKDYKLLKSNLQEEERLVFDSHLYKPKSKKINRCLWQIFVYTDKKMEARRSLWNVFLASNNQVLYQMNSEGDFERYQNHNR